MSKTLLYRLFKAGKLPSKLESQIHREGIVLFDEGIGGSVTYRGFRAPGRRHGFRRSWFSGSIVLTKEHFLAFQFSRPIIGVPWNHDKIGELNCCLEGDQILRVAFDAAAFYEDWSGGIEVRFSTLMAQSFLDVIKQKTA